MTIKDTLLGMNLDLSEYINLLSFDDAETVIAVRDVDEILNFYGQNVRSNHSNKPGLMKEPKHFSLPSLVEHIAQSETRDKVKKLRLLEKHYSDMISRKTPETPDNAALPEDNPYCALGTPDLLYELGETDCATIGEVKKHYPQLYQALWIKGIIGRKDRNSSTISNIIAEARGRAEKQRKVPKKRVKSAETPTHEEPSSGDYIAVDETPSETSNKCGVVGSDYGSKVSYARFSRQELKEMMNKINKKGGILPSADHPFCKKLIAELVLTPNGYKKLITIGAEHPRIRKVFESFGIGGTDGDIGEAVTYLFNRAYFPAASGEHILDDAISSRILEPYINANSLAHKYAEEKGIPPEEAKKRVLEIGMHAFKEGFEEFTERLDKTEEYFLLNIPAIHLQIGSLY